jgi:signal transduction histidine kinase/CheY-like chemotaxis protein
MQVSILSNYYYFVTVFTALYALTFLYFLASRFHNSRPARGLAFFLGGVFLWSVKDSFISALFPYLDTAMLHRSAVITAALFMIMPLVSFNLLMSIRGTDPAAEKRADFSRIVLIGMAVVLALVYYTAFFNDSFLYAAFAKNGYDYRFKLGPGLYIFALVQVAALAIPAYLLMFKTSLHMRRDGVLIGIGSLLGFGLVVGANFIPAIFPATALPRFGVASVSLISAATFWGIIRHHGTFSIHSVLEELHKIKMIGESLKGLSGVFDERTIMQNICDVAREISESLHTAMVLFHNEYKEFEIHAVSRSAEAADGMFFTKLALDIGRKYPIALESIFLSLAENPQPMACKTLEDLFEDSVDPRQAKELNRSAGIRQIVCYPIVLDNQVKGSIVLFRTTPTGNLEIYSLFAIQGALVLRFATQIQELEEKRKIEEMLHHAQKLDAIGQLAGGIAHDFNNMLAGIGGYAQLIKRQFAKDNPKLDQYIDTILKASERAADLTNKLLAFARKGTYQMVPVDIHTAIAEVLQLLAHAIDKKIDIRQHLNASSATVMGDPTQIQNILINLALNARDAMPRGGIMSFTTGSIELQASDKRCTEFNLKPGWYITLVVADSGTGMDKTVLDHIYEPFFTTKGVGKGVGLGLASVYGSVKDHAGHIDVVSLPGEGSTFTVYLPHREAPIPIEPVPPQTRMIETVAARGKGMGHILVIDDEKIVGELCEEILRLHGFSVTFFSNSPQGVTYYQQHFGEIDVVILDMIMPHMSGDECLREMLKVKPDAAVIISTGYDFTAKTQKIITKGIAGYIHKPFSERTVLAAINKAMQREAV